jgi:hypothetical protein
LNGCDLLALLNLKASTLPKCKQLSYLQLQELRPPLPLRLEMLNPRLILATPFGQDIKLFSLLFDRRL